MIRRCAKCHAEYTLGPISFDSGFCPACKPRFFSAPLCLQSSPAGTRHLWLIVAVIHIILLLPLGMLLDAAVISIPGMVYCMTVLLYSGSRFILAHFKGFPTLSRSQAVALLLLPLYGLPLFLFVFYLGWALRSLLQGEG